LAFVPAGSASVMPVLHDPPTSGQGKSESVTSRTVVVVPFSPDRPAAAASPSAAAQAAAQAAAPAQTPEMQEEMRKRVDAARAAVADLQAAAPAERPEVPPAQHGAPVTYPSQPYPAQPYPGPPLPEGATPPPYYGQVPDLHAHQALEAATAMARATTAL